LEGLACGLPVLLSDIAPHTEIVALKPLAGSTYSLGDETSFIAAVQRMLQNSREVMQSAALEVVEKTLSAGAMSSRYQALYLELIASRRGQQHYQV
jgi:glycosyltransferase involved in cell wall biosynthesis